MFNNGLSMKMKCEEKEEVFNFWTHRKSISVWNERLNAFGIYRESAKKNNLTRNDDLRGCLECSTMRIKKNAKEQDKRRKRRAYKSAWKQPLIKPKHQRKKPKRRNENY